MPTYQRHESSDSWTQHPRAEHNQHVPWATPAANLTAADFHMLPPNIQRKFFSSHERLQIIEQAPSPRSPPRPRTLQRARSILSLDHSLDRSASRRTRRLQKPQAARSEALARQQAEAEWYLHLPEKLRRQHFSREEQTLLASRCDTLLRKPDTPAETDTTRPPSASAELLEPLGRSHSPPRPQTTSSSSTTNTTTTSDGSGSVTLQRATSVRYFRPHDMASCFDPSYGKRSRGQSSSRRTLSLSGASIRHSTSSIPSLLPSPIPPFSAGHRRNFSATPRKSESSGSTFDPNAVHYKDPEARAKLRTYLGSPQKFDEAVEFGFPSNQAPETAAALELPADFLAPLNLSHDVQSFMNDDWLPFMESEEEDGKPGPEAQPEEPIHDDSSVPDLPSPVTPGDHEEIYHRAQRMALKSSARHSTYASPHQQPPHQHQPQQQQQQQQQQSPPLKQQPSFLNSYSNGGFGMREMTLRLTLTRPDLRANEDELYGWQHGKPRDDALALEELPVSDDTNGEGNPFRPGGGGGGASSIKTAKRDSKSLKRYFTIRKDRKIWGYELG